MYTPKHFALEDPARIHELIESYSFATLVTALSAVPQAVHLPFLYDPAAGDKGTLYAHLARANPQWQDFDALAAAGGEALVIFQGPHAYVSPNDYHSDKPNVPTWNYLAVHAYGCPRLLSDEAAARDLLARLSAKHEADRAAPWRFADLPTSFSEAMMKGIVAFEIPLTRLEAKAKLSQNKTRQQTASAAVAMAAADDTQRRLVGEEMARALQEGCRLAEEGTERS